MRTVICILVWCATTEHLCLAQQPTSQPAPIPRSHHTRLDVVRVLRLAPLVDRGSGEDSKSLESIAVSTRWWNHADLALADLETYRKHVGANIPFDLPPTYEEFRTAMRMMKFCADNGKVVAPPATTDDSTKSNMILPTALKLHEQIRKSALAKIPEDSKRWAQGVLLTSTSNGGQKPEYTAFECWLVSVANAKTIKDTLDDVRTKIDVSKVERDILDRRIEAIDGQIRVLEFVVATSQPDS